MKIQEIYLRFEELSDNKRKDNYQKYGINMPEVTYGIKIPNLKHLAKENRNKSFISNPTLGRRMS